MVDAEVGPLRPLEQNALASLEGRVQPGGGVYHEGRESLPVGLVFHEQRVRIESLAPAIRVDEALLDRHDRLELRAEQLRVDQVAHADPEPPDLILERGTDPPQSR